MFDVIEAKSSDFVTLFGSTFKVDTKLTIGTKIVILKITGWWQSSPSVSVTSTTKCLLEEV